jgi:hypothetical protein
MHLRFMAAVAVLLVSASAAHAGLAEELIAAINKCESMPDTNTRHTCYDRLPAVVKSLTTQATAQASAAAPMPTTTPMPAATPTAAAATPAPAPATPARPESKGFLASLFDSDDDPLPAEITTATVESYTFDYGIFVVTLDNGQVWRQVAALGDRVPLSQERKNQVKIWRKASGEFVLKIDNSPTKYHVRRIK